MNAVVRSSAFKTGNSVAVRLPKAFGVKPGDAVEISQRGRDIEIRVLNDPEFERAQLAELHRRLHALGPVIADPDSETGRIEFPDRPGLY